ncbi:hypothetical protein QJS66_21070 [Kocuria rhizophila]|nr:hypothetical protein QJS66_21070 [Kocuria rhizophila]
MSSRLRAGPAGAVRPDHGSAPVLVAPLPVDLPERGRGRRSTARRCGEHPTEGELPTVGTPGFLYPGKGHDRVLDARAGRAVPRGRARAWPRVRRSRGPRGAAGPCRSPRRSHLPCHGLPGRRRRRAPRSRSPSRRSAPALTSRPPVRGALDQRRCRPLVTPIRSSRQARRTGSAGAHPHR